MLNIDYCKKHKRWVDRGYPCQLCLLGFVKEPPTIFEKWAEDKGRSSRNARR